MLLLLTNRTYIAALLTVVAGALTVLGILPTALSDAYIGEAATTITALTTAIFGYRDVTVPVADLDDEAGA